MKLENKVIFTNNEIYEILKNEIVSLELLPGTYIGEIDIAKRFNVSRTPIREVFKRLTYDNLIKVIPNKGTVINPIDFGLISEFMFIREKLETGVIDEIIDTISNENIALLELLLIKQRKLLNDKTIEHRTRSVEFFKLDNQFHIILFNAAHKGTLWNRLVNFMPDYQRFRSLSAEFNTDENLLKLFDQHCDILKCIQAKDINKLREIYKSHIYNGIDTFQQLLKEKEEYFVI